MFSKFTEEYYRVKKRIQYRAIKDRKSNTHQVEKYKTRTKIAGLKPNISVIMLIVNGTKYSKIVRQGLKKESTYVFIRGIYKS